jgi:Bifunctional DNA primase/polymerase, N-terminal
MNVPAASTPSPDRFRPATQPSPGNGDVRITAAPERTVAQALAFARREWPVFPCRPGTKEPLTQHGFQDASLDPEQIRCWWKRWPTANLAVATGAPGPDVLDVDQHGSAGNGYPGLIRLKSADLLDTAGTIVKTPHGGLHVYFTGSRQSSGRLPRQHLDFKSTGGYVLAPPSQADGRPYQVVRQLDPSGRLSWAAVTRLLDPQVERAARISFNNRGDLGRLAAWVERLEEGNRNAGLYWAACRAVESGKPDWLDEIAAAAERTGLSEREISRTIESARRGSMRGAIRQPEREATR